MGSSCLIGTDHGMQVTGAEWQRAMQNPLHAALQPLVPVRKDRYKTLETMITMSLWG